LNYEIIEKDTDAELVKKLLKKINEYFLNRFSTHDIFSKKPKYFRKFDERVNEILGDIRMKTEDRFKSIF
jgi:hypothetical protein